MLYYFPKLGLLRIIFYTLDNKKRELFRGISKMSLYITSIGIDISIATNNIKAINGLFRIISLLK